MGGIPVTYDLNGNIVSDSTHAYTHDAVNRLTSVDGTITYTYDAMGRRVSKTVGATTTNYVYDGARVIAEYDGAGQLLRKYVYGPGLDEPVLMQVGAVRYYYLFDSLGSVIGLTDASGNLVEAYRYNAYGQPLQVSTVGNPFMFTGRRFDSETGLYYYRNRYYSPQLRRFIEPDPIGFEGGMNLYAYVGNDPGNALDPWGLDPPPFPYQAFPGLKRTPTNPFYIMTLGNVFVAESINSPVTFYFLVHPGGDKDYKLYFSSWQDFGNYNFGVMGAATGLFTLETMLREAGSKQCDTGTSRPDFGTPATGPPYGDDERDQRWIKEGWNDYFSGSYGKPKSPNSIMQNLTERYSRFKNGSP